MSLSDSEPGILGDPASFAGSGQGAASSSNLGNPFTTAQVGSSPSGPPQWPSAPSSAAPLPLSTYAPATPLPDLREGTIPVPSLDDLARSPPFNMTDQQLAAIRARAEHQALTSGLASLALGPIVDFALGEAGAPELIANLAGAGIDFHDLWNIMQRLRSAPDNAVYKQLNDSMNQWSHAQSVPPPWRGIP